MAFATDTEYYDWLLRKDQQETKKAGRCMFKSARFTKGSAPRDLRLKEDHVQPMKIITPLGVTIEVPSSMFRKDGRPKKKYDAYVQQVMEAALPKEEPKKEVVIHEPVLTRPEYKEKDDTIIVVIRNGKAHIFEKYIDGRARRWEDNNA